MFKVIIWPILLSLAAFGIYPFVGLLRCQSGLFFMDIASCQVKTIYFILVILTILLYSFVSFLWIKAYGAVRIGGLWFLAILVASGVITTSAFFLVPLFAAGIEIAAMIVFVVLRSIWPVLF